MSASISAALTWATPIRVDVSEFSLMMWQSTDLAVQILGAHLEAYTNILPVVNALKLCNRQ
jgi:hypothetical protein